MLMATYRKQVKRMNKCNGNCHYLKQNWVGGLKIACYCKAQKNTPRVDPWLTDCPYNILINKDMRARRDVLGDKFYD